MDEDMDLEELAAILSAMGGYDEELNDLDQQILQAQKLRDRQMTGGTQAGRVFVADNPLEALSVIGDKYIGMRDEKARRADKKGVLGKQTAGRQAMMDAFMKKMGATTPEVPDLNYDDELMG